MQKKIKARKTALLAATMLLLILAGCQAKQEQIDIAFSACEENTSRSVALIRDILSLAEKGDKVVELRSADNKLKQQIMDIQELTALHPKYMIVIPVKTIGLESVLQEASDAGIQVIIADRNMEKSLYQDYLTQIASDAYEEGRMCARQLGKYFAGKEAEILEVQGSAGSSLTNDRSRGFRDQLSGYENLEIKKVVNGNFDRIEANRSVKEYLQQGGTFDAVFGHSDEDGLGAMMALQEQNDKVQIPIVSVNGQQEVRDALLSGNYLATVYVTPMLGTEVMGAITEYEAGDTPEKQITMRDTLYDQGNASSLQEY